MRPEPQQQETEASESAPAPESSSENQSPGEDATSDDDSEYLPGARSMRIQRRVETEAMIRQMRRFDVALNESQNENNARDLVDLVMERRRLRGVL